MSAQANIVGSTLQLGSDGWRHSVRYFVDGATDLKDAIDQTVAHGTASAIVPLIFAFDFNAEHASDQPKQFWVTVVYRRPDPHSTVDDPPDPTPSGGTIQVGSRLQPATFTKDVGGAQIKTQHLFADTDRTGLVVQPAEVEGFVPTTVLSVTRTEQDSPIDNAKAFVGKLNSGTFFGEPAESWLCTAIEGVSEDNGGTYSITYEFELKPGGWDATVVFIDDKTNRPPDGITTGVELQSYQLYQTINFNPLNL